jgi:para-aminobenzoate synthetase component 1
MSQRFQMDFDGDTFSLFKTLYNNNPAPFFAYINAGNHQIVSTSPERFLLQTGEKVETRPIKGTRPRGNTPVEDKRLGRELEQSKKDDAELSMIVDLLRNDIGKVCKAGSVRVAEHKRLEAYQNVFHLVSIVEGRLEEGRDAIDLLRATFPGGSITGCPKIRTMEIIDELEPNRRHIYTGSIGYISFHNTMDLSIAIRTATVYNGKIFFSVGGGIVFDSDPHDEFEETIHKGRTLMEVFKGKEEKSTEQNYVWINGTLEPLDQASIPVWDQGFQYGFGFFETIRVDNGNPRYLEGHIDDYRSGHYSK